MFTFASHSRDIAENLREVKQMLQKITDDTQPPMTSIQYMRKMTHLINVYDEMSEVKVDQMILRALIKGMFSLCELFLKMN